jgi:hypothetical protein
LISAPPRRHAFLLDGGELHTIAGDALDVPGGRAQLLPYAVEMSAPPSPDARAAFLQETGLSVEQAGDLLCGEELAAALPGLRTAHGRAHGHPVPERTGGACEARCSGIRTRTRQRRRAGGASRHGVCCYQNGLPSVRAIVQYVPARRRFSGRGRLLPLVGALLQHHTTLSAELFCGAWREDAAADAAHRGGARTSARHFYLAMMTPDGAAPAAEAIHGFTRGTGDATRGARGRVGGAAVRAAGGVWWRARACAGT